MAPAALIDLQPLPAEQPSPSAYRRDSIIANAIYRKNLIGAEVRNPTYHQDKKSGYVLPNDFAEQVRLEAQAVHLSAMMNDHVLHALVEDGSEKRMLDIGCGTGIVTDLIAEKYPEAQVFGLDLSKVPNLRCHEKNVRFLQGNVTTQKPSDWGVYDGGKKLAQEAGCFDYIFSRLLIAGMHDWPDFIKTEYNLLAPGGWVEVHDLDWDWFDRNDNVISEDWSWLQTMIETLEKEKRLNMHCGSGAQKWLKEAGFVDVQVFEYRWPFGGQRRINDRNARIWRVLGSRNANHAASHD